MAEADPSERQRAFAPGTRARRLFVALVIYALATLVLWGSADPVTLAQHTRANHFALLAAGWLDGRLDLGGPPPAYTGLNDFARYDGDWFVVFPPLPALLLLPLVGLAETPEQVRDGRLFVLLSGLAPALVFLVLEKLSRSGESSRSESDNIALAGLFAFGSVYFFSAVQGSVWFAAHVVGAVLLALYALFALRAERPVLAGACLALAFATRAPMIFAAPLFLSELLRAARASEAGGAGFIARHDVSRLARGLVAFALPIALVAALLLWHNHARFDDAFEPGYRYLQIAWQKRIEKWGLFDYHYLARNLGVMLTSLPWISPSGLVINGHGLALWLTTPMYLWLLWPRRRSSLVHALYGTAALVALPSLFYQNTGWVQFGYRFSNDFSVLLFMLLAIAGPALRGAFVLAATFSVLVNFFGALTFGRAEHASLYFIEGSQRIIYQPD